MRNYEIQFDMDSGKTLFSRANCSNLRNFDEIYKNEMNTDEEEAVVKDSEEIVSIEDIIKAEKQSDLPSKIEQDKKGLQKDAKAKEAQPKNSDDKIDLNKPKEEKLEDNPKETLDAGAISDTPTT